MQGLPRPRLSFHYGQCVVFLVCRSITGNAWSSSSSMRGLPRPVRRFTTADAWSSSSSIRGLPRPRPSWVVFLVPRPSFHHWPCLGFLSRLVLSFHHMLCVVFLVLHAWSSSSRPSFHHRGQPWSSPVVPPHAVCLVRRSPLEIMSRESV